MISRKLFGIFILLFLLAIIIESYVNNKTNKNRYLQSEDIIQRNIHNLDEVLILEKGDEIPKNIIQTYKSEDLVPPFVFKNIKEKNKDWNYFFYDDEGCRKFLREEFGQRFQDKFDSFKKGAHKSDLFRLCWLYKNGGVYVDIDTQLIVSLDQIVSKINDFTIMKNTYRRNFYDDMVSRMLDVKHETLINSFIVTKKGDPRLRKCIQEVMKITQYDLENNYPLILFVMQNTLRDEIEYQVFEKIDNTFIPFIDGEGVMYDKDGKVIGYSKYKQYNQGF